MIHIGGVDLDAASLAIIAAAAAIGGFLRGFVGFGGALAIVPPLALVLGPKLAVGVASLVGMPAVVQFLPEIVRQADRSRIAPVTLAILLGAPLGSLILTSIDQRLMTGVIGLLVIVMALATWRSPSRRLASRAWVNLVAGGLSGILQGAAGIGGPPSVAVLMAQGGEPRQLRADVLAITAAIGACGAVSHLWFGVLTFRAAAIAAILLPFFVGFTALGSRYFSNGGARHFRAAALGVLLVIGAVAMAGAAHAWLATDGR